MIENWKSDRQILYTLANSKEPMTMADLYKALPKINPTTLRYHVAQLMKKGFVIRNGKPQATREHSCRYEASTQQKSAYVGV